MTKPPALSYPLKQRVPGRKLDVAGPLTMAIQGRMTWQEHLIAGDEVLTGPAAPGWTGLLVHCANECSSPNTPDGPFMRL